MNRTYQAAASGTPQVARAVLIPKAAELTGYSVKAIERKIERGIWREGIEWCKAGDGRRHIIMEGYYKWVGLAAE